MRPTMTRDEQLTQPDLQLTRSQLSVLVVDDARDNRHLIEAFLRGSGVHAVYAENGTQALEVVAKESFDLILLDLQMPVLDGYATVQELRARGIKTTTLALTAHTGDRELSRAIAAGCDGYICKPFKRLELLSLFQRRDAQRVPIESELSDITPEVAQLVQEFISGLSSHKLLMHEYFAQRRFSELATAAHTLRGVAALYGFPELSAACATLENAAQVGSYRDVNSAYLPIVAQVELIQSARPAPHSPGTGPHGGE